MKICGFFSKKKKKEKVFRNVFANLIIGVVLIGLFIITYTGGTLNAFNANEVEAVYHGNTSSKNISLMINVYWGNDYIEPMLKTLKDNNIKTTFFVGGTWAKQYPELLKMIYNNGHEIANHGFYHKDHKNISYQQNKNEILNTHNLIKEILGVEMDLFAPPSGSYSKTTIETAKELGYTSIMWSRDTIDWRDQDENLIYSRAVKNAAGGDLILMHPTEKTAAALPKIIETLLGEGFNLTTVSECLKN